MQLMSIFITFNWFKWAFDKCGIFTMIQHLPQNDYVYDMWREKNGQFQHVLLHPYIHMINKREKKKTPIFAISLMH